MTTIADIRKNLEAQDRATRRPARSRPAKRGNLGGRDLRRTNALRAAAAYGFIAGFMLCAIITVFCIILGMG